MHTSTHSLALKKKRGNKSRDENIRGGSGGKGSQGPLFCAGRVGRPPGVLRSHLHLPSWAKQIS